MNDQDENQAVLDGLMKMGHTVVKPEDLPPALQNIANRDGVTAFVESMPDWTPLPAEFLYLTAPPEAVAFFRKSWSPIIDRGLTIVYVFLAKDLPEPTARSGPDGLFWWGDILVDDVKTRYWMAENRGDMEAEIRHRFEPYPQAKPFVIGVLTIPRDEAQAASDPP